MDKNYGVAMNSAYRGNITNSNISSLLVLSGVTMSNGNWTLYIENTSGVNLGVLEDWEMQFGYSDRIGAKLYDKSIAIDTGLRIVSNFQSANWKTGIWTNGIFNNGLFESGLWYNGVFNGTWG
jgi:subtilisin-like proprotein convertase family protein